jgi:predicted CoA-binding protein
MAANVNKTVLVIGASPNAQRYSNLAIQRLRAHGHPVIAVGKNYGKIVDVEIKQKAPLSSEIDTVSLYINPAIQREYYDYLIKLHPRRIIFNPGAENKELEDLAEKNGIIAQEACTLVLLSTEQF